MSTTTRKARQSPARTPDAHVEPPTRNDNAQLRRHLGARDRQLQACYEAGLTSKPRNPEWVWYGDEYLAWLDGRFERNRRRQEAVATAVYRLVAWTLRLFCRRCRKHHPKAERRLRRLGARMMRSVRSRRERRDRDRWDWSPVA